MYEEEVKQMIILKKLNKVYGETASATVALKDVDLVIEKGKFTAIVGKSGSGKTTLMNMVGALDKPTSGSLTIDEVEITNLTEDLLASYRNKTIGFVFQSFYLEPTFTVLENVAMPLTIAGVDRIERETKAKEILIKLGLEDKIYKKASDLSSGQKQRVCIARALINDPEIILADEPTGNLDTQNGEEVMKILKEISESGKTVILVTHDLDDIKYADNLIEIKDGVVSCNYSDRYEDLFK